MNTRIDALYDFVLQQIAAECHFEGVPLSDARRVRNMLTLGANREGLRDATRELNEGYPGYTRMTEAQADEFLRNFSIVHQWSDNPSTNPGGDDIAARPAPEGEEGRPTLNGDILANTGLSATLIHRRDSHVYGYKRSCRRRSAPDTYVGLQWLKRGANSSLGGVYAP